MLFELFLCDSEFSYKPLQKNINHSGKFDIDLMICLMIFFPFVKQNAIFIQKYLDWIYPRWTTQKLQNCIVNPLILILLQQLFLLLRRKVCSLAWLILCYFFSTLFSLLSVIVWLLNLWRTRKSFQLLLIFLLVRRLLLLVWFWPHKLITKKK